MSDNTHVFTEAGLGQHPFEYRGCIDRGATASNCDYCGNGIRYEHWIRSADGKDHKVGSDCICKSGDEGLVAEQKLAEKKRKEEQRYAEAYAKCMAYNAKVEAQEAEQRERNGGLTDREVEVEQAMRAKASAEARCRVENSWLIDKLGRGGFCDSMRQALSVSPASSLSTRTRNILCDIYAKSHGNRSSIEYKFAHAKAQARLFPQQEQSK